MNDTNPRSFARLVFLTLLGLVVAACTAQPFSEGPNSAVGLVETALGDQYTVSAQELTAEWTFQEGAQVVLSFGGGDVMVNGRNLEPGCFAGLLEEGDVIEYRAATDVEFATPAEDPECGSISG